MKCILAAAMACALTMTVKAHNTLTFHGYPPGLGTYEYERRIGNYIDSRVPPVHIPVVPETNPALILGAILLVGAGAYELRRCGSCKVQTRLR
jgi:hypothetical protein